MDDRDIIELYWKRAEEVIPSTAAKYGRYLGGISYNILGTYEDAEECVNDTYLRVTNIIRTRQKRRNRRAVAFSSFAVGTAAAHSSALHLIQFRRFWSAGVFTAIGHGRARKTREEYWLSFDRG